MKNLTALIGILIFAGNTWANCPGGHEAVLCDQLSPVGSKFAARLSVDPNDNSITTDIKLTINATEDSDRLKCTIDHYGQHDSKQICTSSKYSYRIIDNIYKPKSNDPYILGAHELLAAEGSRANFPGLVIENLQTHERAVLVCQEMRLCPSN